MMYLGDGTGPESICTFLAGMYIKSEGGSARFRKKSLEYESSCGIQRLELDGTTLPSREPSPA